MDHQTRDTNSNDIDNDATLIAKFREFCATNKETAKYELTDVALISYLRSRNYDFHGAHRALANICQLIRDRPDVFSWRDYLSEFIKSGVYVHYPIKNVDGSKLVLIRPAAWDLKKYKFIDVISLACIISDATAADDEVQRSGCVVVINVQGLTLSHIYQIGISGARLVSYLDNQCSPLKVNRTHIIHVNWLTDTAYSFFKPFLSEDFKKKIQFHGDNLDAFYEQVPKSHLPPEFEGFAQQFSPEYYSELLLKNKDNTLEKWRKTQEAK